MQAERVMARYLPMTETMFYILLSLRAERHGYGIMQHVRDLTEGRIVLGAGTVYQSLSKLSGDGLIAPTGETARQKKYLITDLGRAILTEEARRIRELYRMTEDLL